MSKLIIAKENFYELDTYTEQAQFRFRIITDDKNYSSYWSPIYSISPTMLFVRGDILSPGNLSLEKHMDYVNASWDGVSLYHEADIISQEELIGQLPYYDVWIQFSGENGINPGEWEYKERVSATSYNIVMPSQYEYAPGEFATPDLVNVEIYRPGRPAIRYKKIEYSITQNSSTVDIANDKIVISTNHNLSHGDAVLYTSASPIGGLVSGKLYFASHVSANSFSLYSNQNDAINGTNKINLTSTGSGTGTFEYYPFLLYKASSIATPSLLIIDGGGV